MKFLIFLVLLVGTQDLFADVKACKAVFTPLLQSNRKWNDENVTLLRRLAAVESGEIISTKITLHVGLLLDGEKSRFLGELISQKFAQFTVFPKTSKIVVLVQKENIEYVYQVFSRNHWIRISAE